MTQDCHSEGGADWGLARICRRNLDVDDTFATKLHLGEGVDIYVIDTGINLNHVDFGGRAIFGFKASSSWPNNDDQGHGTHVASTCGGTKYGVAKKATLIGVKVLDSTGSGTTAGVVAGVEFAVKNRQARGKPSVGNMSLGGGKSSALDAAVNKASDEGVIMIVAAGNDNSNACSGSPSGAARAFAVGATDIGADASGNNYDVRSSFSNYGSCVSVFAPGSNILGAWIGSTTAVRTISGTSMASPHVAGAAAVTLADNPTWTFADVKKNLQDQATLDKINLSCTSSTCRASKNLLLYIGCDA
jgi:subtilisin family serine protease